MLDFVGDACKAIASPVHCTVAGVQFDDFHEVCYCDGEFRPFKRYLLLELHTNHLILPHLHRVLLGSFDPLCLEK